MAQHLQVFGPRAPMPHSDCGCLPAATPRPPKRPRPRQSRSRSPPAPRSAAAPGDVQLGYRPAVAGRARADNTSDVEVWLFAEDQHRTRLELEHRHIDRQGPRWQVVRDGVAGEASWPLYLSRYAALITRGA